MGALAVQCSALIPFDGYVAGADASADAAAADATFDHAASDGRAGEAGYTSDGGVSDASVLDGDAGRWCAHLVPAPMFCEDFDDEGNFTKWTSVVQRNGGTLARDTNDFRSAPNSLLSRAPGSAMSQQAYLDFIPPTEVKHVKLAFDLRIDARDQQTGYAEIAYVVFNSPIHSDFYIRAYQDPATNGYTAESYPDGSAVQHNLSLGSTMTFDTWRRVAIDIDVATANALTVSIDGVQIVNQPLESTLYVPAGVEVRPGIGYTGSPSNLWSMRWDNVTIDWN
jgi:hypothetical protein